MQIAFAYGFPEMQSLRSVVSLSFFADHIGEVLMNSNLNLAHIDGGSLERYVIYLTIRGLCLIEISYRWEDVEYRKCYSEIVSGNWRAFDPFKIGPRLNANSDLYQGASQVSPRTPPKTNQTNSNSIEISAASFAASKAGLHSPRPVLAKVHSGPTPSSANPSPMLFSARSSALPTRAQTSLTYWHLRIGCWTWRALRFLARSKDVDKS